ncbi:hypothetical protein D3C80_1841750 [compost metagenome]
MAKRAHGIEEMRYHGCACISIGRRNIETGVGMAEADDDAGVAECCNLLDSNIFRRNGCQHEGEFRLAAG